MGPYRLHLLGGFDLVRADGTACELPPRKCRALLARVCLARNHQCARDDLGALLWPEADAAQGRASLRQALTVLRRLAPVLDADNERVTAAPALEVVDAWDLERLAHSADMADLESALHCYRGELLSGHRIDAAEFEEWRRAENERLRRLALDAGTRLVGELITANALERAAAGLLQLLTLEPLREDFHRQLMGAYAALGRPADALRQYEHCRQVLADQLGVAPDPDTVALHRKLLVQRGRQEPRPAAPEEPPAPSVALPPVSASDAREALVAIADVSGFTAFAAAADVDRVHEFVTRYRREIRAIVSARGGTLTNFIGARVMFVFGTPTAHGNDAARMADAALAILRMVEDMAAELSLRARVGVAHGRVILAYEDGAPVVSGAPVSAAGRLVELVPGGELWVMDGVAQALGERAVKALVEGVSVPGLGNALRLWRVRQVGPLASGEAAIFVGRRGLLRRVDAILAEVLHSGQGHVVHVTGPAGIGKSRLLDQMIERARARGFAPLLTRAQGFGLHEDDPLAQLVAGMLDVPMGRGSDDPLADGRRLDERIAALALPPMLRPPLAALLGLPQHERDAGLWDTMNDEARRKATDNALSRLAAAAARQHPLLLAVDDLHGVTEPRLAPLEVLARSVPHMPVVLAVTGRTDPGGDDGAWNAAVAPAALTRFDLRALTPLEAAEMAGHYPVSDEEFVTRCLERSEGHPFFLDQLLRAGTSVSASVPGSIQNVVLARVDTLPAEAREALQVGAVLGQRFTLDALRATLGQPLYDPAVLVSQSLLRNDGDSLEFTHALIRDAVADALRTPVRHAWHRRAAAHWRTADPVLAAEHLAAAGDPDAARLFRDAARAEFARSQHDRALALAQKGLTCSPADELRAELLVMEGDALAAASDAIGAEPSYRRAASLARDDAMRCRARIGLGDVLRQLDRQPEALAVLEEAHRLATRLEDVAQLAHVALLRGHAYFPLGRTEACKQAFETARDLAQRSGSVELLARAFAGLADAEYQRGRFITANRLFAQCVGLARERHLGRVRHANLPMLAITHAYCLQLEDAIAAADETLELAHASRDLRSQTVALVVGAEVRCLAGRWHEGATLADHCSDLARRTGSRRFLAEALAIGAYARHALGDSDLAREQLQEAVPMVRQVAMAYCGPVVLAIQAWTAPDAETRRSALEEGRAQLAAGAVSHNHLHFHSIAAEIALLAGDADTALEEVRQLEAYLGNEVSAWPRLVVARARALVRTGRGERSEDLRTELAALRDWCAAAEVLPMTRLLERALDGFEAEAMH